MIGDFLADPDGSHFRAVIGGFLADPDDPNLGFFVIVFWSGAWVLCCAWACYHDWYGVGTSVAKQTVPGSLSLRTRRLLNACLGFGLGTIGIMVGIVGTIVRLAGR